MFPELWILEGRARKFLPLRKFLGSTGATVHSKDIRARLRMDGEFLTGLLFWPLRESLHEPWSKLLQRQSYRILVKGLQCCRESLTRNISKGFWIGPQSWTQMGVLHITRIYYTLSKATHSLYPIERDPQMGALYIACICYTLRKAKHSLYPINWDPHSSYIHLN